MSHPKAKIMQLGPFPELGQIFLVTTAVGRGSMLCVGVSCSGQPCRICQLVENRLCSTARLHRLSWEESDLLPGISLAKVSTSTLSLGFLQSREILSS